MKNSIIVIFHVIFWVILILTNSIYPLLARYLPLEEFGSATIIANYLVPVVFYLSYFSIKYFTSRKKRIIYAILSISVILLTLYIISNKIFIIVLVVASRLLLWLIIGGLFRFFSDWLKKREIYNKLEKQNLESELALLRNQINPHFLFNTIHNIDTLISKNPEKASKSLIKLSDIMRYMLNETKNRFVQLSKEIEYLNNFFLLQKLRISNPRSIHWKVVGSPENIEIPPMLFIPFLENAFKHGDTDDNNQISASLNISRNLIKFSCANTILKGDLDKDNISGIGLETIKRRLELLYPDKHNLKITEENDIFEVNLSINLYVS